ncbi:MAG: hypothetical protein HYU67_04520 [Flavobacteriia bacterium]|nr:hypothetical protein [Flavobacteriia bacterium]
MKKTFKAFSIVLLGSIIFSGLVYIAIAFVLAELNPFFWSINARGLMVFLIFCYASFIPLMVIALKSEME